MAPSTTVTRIGPHDLHAAVAAAAGNRVLELIALVFIRLSRIYQIQRLATGGPEQTRATVLRTHEAIAPRSGRATAIWPATGCDATWTPLPP